MHPNNYTLYQLIKFHIELTEAMEYTLITYKYNEGELIQRFDFLKNDYKKGFFHEIVKTLFNKPKKLTKEIKIFIKKYNPAKINKLVNEHNLHSRAIYNNELYLAYANSNNIIQVFLNEETIKKELETSLINLISIANKHFILFCLLDTLNLYVSSKVNVLQGDELYQLDEIDKNEMIKLINSIKDKLNENSLIEETLDLIIENKTFKEDDAYELLNKISIECTKSEKDLYENYDNFTKSVQKELEKEHK